jgi:putative ABC transport system permease protein
LIRHLLKLVWHRKRANALITGEILASFLIVFAVATLTISLWVRWKTPLGFGWRDVWVMNVVSSVNREVSGTHTTPNISVSEKTHAQQNADDVASILKELKAFPQIEVAAASAMSVYSQRTWTTVLTAKGRGVDVTADNVSDDYAKAMGMKVLKGRWFTDDDEVQNYQPVVLDADAAKMLFGDEEPVGQKMPANRFNDDPAMPQDFKVVGVVAPYRKNGEFTATTLNMAFFRISRRFPPTPEGSQIVLKLRPGTPASFEAELNERLRPVSAGVRYRIRRLEDARRGALRTAMTSVAVMSIVAAFLVSMVALGLTGVLWQTVTRRTREIGLRRAVGASRQGVRAQVLGEVAVLVTFAVIVGAIIIVQLPLLGAFRLISPSDFAWGFSVALAAIYSITLLCGAYPSWLASTIQPATALHYE